MEIKFEDVYLQKNKRYLLKDINFKIKNKSIHALMGNDSKKLIIDIIFNKEKILTGNISYDNNINLEVSSVSYCNIVDLYEDCNVEKYIKNNNITKNFSTERILNSFKLVGLSESVLYRDPNNLSLGEKTKLRILLALLNNSNLLIIEEASLGLDTYDRKRIINLFKKLKNRYNRTIILISNDLNFIIELSDDITIFQKNQILISDRKNSVIKEFKLLKKVSNNLPLTIEFADLVHRKKQIKIGYRTNINDLLKDIYRHAEWGISKNK